MSRVLFVCLHNAGRSQMSQALFERMAAGRHEARSAGTEPAQRVHPNVVTVMKEEGIDVGGHVPQKLTDELGRWADIRHHYGMRRLVSGHPRQALHRLESSRPEGSTAR